MLLKILKIAFEILHLFLHLYNLSTLLHVKMEKIFCMTPFDIYFDIYLRFIQKVEIILTFNRQYQQLSLTCKIVIWYLQLNF